MTECLISVIQIENHEQNPTRSGVVPLAVWTPSTQAACSTGVAIDPGSVLYRCDRQRS